MANLIVRHGPSPGETEDAGGLLHATFTGFFTLVLSPEDARRLVGTDGTDAEDPEAFVALIRRIWARVTAPRAGGGLGKGHILVGVFSSFDFAAVPACGLQLGASPFSLKNYVPLFAVARAPGVDLAVDYRGTRGPGDTAVRPVIFGAAPAAADVGLTASP